ncbi:MAG: glycosyltransferase [Pirellulaceae bacterium]|nr:glycosyltransferase [Pirellulaceae bacterium]
MTKPTLTVVMPNYNHAKYLPRSLDAVLRQTRPPDEFLVLDDASTDNSVEILEQYEQQHSVMRVLRNETNQGVNVANNRLFAEATGDYLHAAAADDNWPPSFYESAMGMAQSHPQAGLIFGKMEICDQHGDLLSTVAVSAWREPLFADPARYLAEYLDAELATHAATVSTIFRRDAFMSVGGYRSDLGSWADSFAARAVGLRHGACYLPDLCGRMTRVVGSHSDQSNQQPAKQIEMIARAARMMRSDEFRDTFPAEHVARWRREFRRLTIWNYWLGSDAERSPSFLIRNLRRLPRTWRALALYCFHKS